MVDDPSTAVAPKTPERRHSNRSLEDDDEADEAYLDDDAWKAKETEYRKQVEGLEAQHATLRDAWSDIVRTNLMAVDELKAELKRKTAARDAAKAARDDVVTTGDAKHERLVAELAAAKVSVAELSEARDRAQKLLGEEARKR
mmetsp:Transcript_21658/g.66634  ORF Transcript_21658/g.66634 Transcript_21658/m.66634 type:complete len:143 (-) Transcript_21658:211-639(-)